jgi:hypothetical protein
MKKVKRFRKNLLPSHKAVVCLHFESAAKRFSGRAMRMAPMLRNALENQGFSNCPADGERFTWDAIAAVVGSYGEPARAAATYGEAARQEADR